jgi:hypothetical protein
MSAIETSMIDLNRLETVPATAPAMAAYLRPTGGSFLRNR